MDDIDYEKAYKEALNEATTAYKDEDKHLKATLERIFPELKDSKDEKIRKIISDILLIDSDEIREILDANNVLMQDIDAWLEKQGERKSDPFNGVSFEYNNHTWGMCVRDGGVDILCDSDLIKHIDNPRDETATVSVMEENVDKVEPKFKVGDWITDGNITIQIEAIKNDCYLYCGDCALYSIKTADKVYHLWTINDAKDGDVLSYVTDEEDLWIMIYRSLYKPYEGHVHYHALLVNDNFGYKGTCCICIDDLKPATKEQRALLFNKMKEAGYEWDVEKKELIKLDEQAPTGDANYADQIDEYKGLTDLEKILTDICSSWIGFELGWQSYIKSNARILKNTIVKQLHSMQDDPSEQNPIKMKGKTALEALEEETVDNANKVESKFKVGDWIVNNITKDVFLIKSFNSGYCTLEDVKGNIISPCLPPCESESHLWSIEDAKDGDVLVASDGSIFLFKGAVGRACKHYVALTADGVVVINEGLEHFWETSTAVHPATKEQCDTLMKAMTDAEYTFDFEKKELKELKKIEQK